MNFLLRQQDFALNTLGSYVYEGVWEKYSEPVCKRRIWTLRDWKALLVLACLAMLVAFTQARAWVLIRYIIVLWKRPVRLHDEANPEPLQHLSQGRAIIEMSSLAMNAISGLQR